ncbi:ankyrin repeat-containing domain protein [Clohesyomyces aquaticus]|uniref:Ankyrin repeat-containing domain protein n=1 Tax=Clohesyomyces aquaticus TaxID=1231657 RepID=A0A1Y1YHH1_9PLEO|nr:ankyrin repeat-containing domain protein [Clohesyomyces aquaticus]
MSQVALEEDWIDDILYLARVNEASELDSFVAELATKTTRSKAEITTAAVDPYSKNSALHYAAANGHIDVIKLLLSYGLDKVTTTASASASGLINAVNEAGNTALHWAALNGHLESVKLLIQVGADVTIINSAGHDAVFEAEINDKKDVVDWLLGAVEELEKGVGQAGAPSGDAGEEDHMDVEHEAENDNNPHGAGELHTADVDGVRSQMEGLNTNDGSPQGG